MNRNEKFVITINRELGSGGRSVGHRLAERLDVKFYDKAVIKGLKEKYHLTTEEIEKLKGQKEGWWAEFQRRVVPFAEVDSAYGASMGNEPEIITTEEVFKAEKEIIKAITDNESCVITGRSAFHVLKDHPNHLSILIQAPMEQRIQRVMKKQELSREAAIKAIKQVDERRENYVQKFCGTSRYDTRNYDLVISMEHLKEDDAVDIILDYIFRQSR
ncbi:MAG: cytidylate kinase-like family protein [Bacteroidaceae bacterium]|nr:cytidylate kinase-like family protein [Bacteroidaceae bacterium]